jgi:serine/threonine protein kinase
MTERFTLLSELGRGGMGVVWKARDEETGQIVALKLLREAYAEDPEYLARFERELELAKRIDSVHVVKVLGFGVRQRVPYLALEYVDGPSLHDLLLAHGPYSWAETRALLIQMTQGLADANAAAVIHRDVKPSNVLIGPDGVAKLTDFGIARGLDSTRMTATSTMLGTPAYLAPEGPKDARSDLYSLGIIGFQLLTGEVPFKGTTYQDVIIEHMRTPPDLNRLPAEARPTIAWLLAKDPAQRPQRASALLPVLYGAAQAPVAKPSAEKADQVKPGREAKMLPIPVFMPSQIQEPIQTPTGSATQPPLAATTSSAAHRVPPRPGSTPLYVQPSRPARQPAEETSGPSATMPRRAATSALSFKAPLLTALAACILGATLVGGYVITRPHTSGVTSIAAGSFFSMALKSDGTVLAWGDDTAGQTNIPADVADISAIAAHGSHALALRSDGTVAAWGDNRDGQSDVPAGLSGVTAVAAGDGFGLALKSDGTVTAWGNDSDGATSVPAGLSRVTAIAAGDRNCLALRGDGTVVTWGWNIGGQLDVPAGLSDVIAISAGGTQSLALKRDGTVVAWGYDGSIANLTEVPTDLTDVTAISAGFTHNLALKRDGTVVAWGDDTDGRADVPAGLADVIAIAAGGTQSLALKRDGTIAAWGWNNYGQVSVP